MKTTYDLKRRSALQGLGGVKLLSEYRLRAFEPCHTFAGQGFLQAALSGIPPLHEPR